MQARSRIGRLGKIVASGAIAVSLVFGPTVFTPSLAATPDNTLVIANTIASMTSLDPAEIFDIAGAEYAFNVYDALVTFDPDNLGPIQPGIAESWTVSDDGKIFTFKIRDGVKFHSGNPVTAEDVEFSFHRVGLLKKTPVFILNGIGITDANVTEAVKATGPNEVTFTLERSFAPSFVLNSIAYSVGSIVDKKVVMEHEQDGDWGNGWLKTNSAGSGAYVLNKWEANVSYDLQANPDYWRQAPHLERVIVRNIQENSVQRLLLEKGDIDIARSLTPDELDGLQSNPDIVVTTDLGGAISYAGLNQKNEILANPKVVEALKYLIDYDGMANSFLRGQFAVHQSFVPRSILGAIDDLPYKLDVDKAKALLAEAGYADGFKVTMHVRNDPIPTTIAQSMQNTWAQAGVELELITGTGAQVIAPYRARTHDIYLGGWGAPYPDPHATAGTFAFNPDNSDEANFTGSVAWRNAWAIPEMSEAADDALQERDLDTRIAKYQALQREHQKVSPFLIMFQQSVQTALRSNVKGFITGSAVTKSFYWVVTK